MSHFHFLRCRLYNDKFYIFKEIEFILWSQLNSYTKNAEKFKMTFLGENLYKILFFSRKMTDGVDEKSDCTF